MFWDKWFKREEKIAQPCPFPKVVFELYPDGNVLINCAWPRPITNEDAVQFVQQYVMLIHMINSGKLLSSVESAIARFDSNDSINIQLAKAILTGVQMIFNTNPISNPEEDKLVVSPIQTFSVRGEE